MVVGLSLKNDEVDIKNNDNGLFSEMGYKFMRRFCTIKFMRKKPSVDSRANPSRTANARILSVIPQQENNVLSYHK